MQVSVISATLGLYEFVHTSKLAR